MRCGTGDGPRMEAERKSAALALAGEALQERASRAIAIFGEGTRRSAIPDAPRRSRGGPLVGVGRAERVDDRDGLARYRDRLAHVNGDGDDLAAISGQRYRLPIGRGEISEPRELLEVKQCADCSGLSPAFKI